MKAVRLTITPTEKEILQAFGNIYIFKILPDGTMEVQFAFARWHDLQGLLAILESSIAFQESLKRAEAKRSRAKSWRAAKPGLKDKIRAAYMQIYQDEETHGEKE